jgi:hypothetical protein
VWPRSPGRQLRVAIGAGCDLFADVCTAIERRGGASAPVDVAAVRGQLRAVLDDIAEKAD